ncbi:MAG: DUF4443 domain-containing protein [Candidatus Helarchaeales archaeon]
MSNRDGLTRHEIKAFLEDRPAGPRSSYSLYHVEWSLRVISRKGPIGRNRLQEEIKVGAGTVRSLIKILKHFGLIDSTTKGLMLTDRGVKTVRGFEVNIPFDPLLVSVPDDISLAEHDALLVVRGVKENLRTGLEQTTAALRIDAAGASTILYSQDKFSMPGIANNLEESTPELVTLLKKIPTLEDDDVIVIGMGSSEEKAIAGAWAAAYSLLNV